jgi:hypothetical protein
MACGGNGGINETCIVFQLALPGGCKIDNFLGLDAREKVDGLVGVGYVDAMGAGSTHSKR